MALSAQGWELAQSEPKTVTPNKPATVATPSPVPVAEVSTAQAAPAPRFRPLAIGLGIGGLVVLGAAATAGLFNVEARRSFASAERMPDGTITGLTRPQAQALEATARTSGLLANIGFGVGGTLLIGAVVTWLVGLPPSVTVAMGPTGVLVASTFP